MTPKERFYVTPHWVACILGLAGAIGISFGVAGGTRTPAEASLLGAIIAVGMGHFISHYFVGLMRLRAALPYRAAEHSTSDVVSIVERLVIFGAFAFSMDIGLKVVAGWIALKTLAKWRAWEGYDEDKATGRGRAIYNIFICGTVVSIACAVASAFFAAWLIDPQRVPTPFTFIASK